MRAGGQGALHTLMSFPDRKGHNIQKLSQRFVKIYTLILPSPELSSEHLILIAHP